MEYTALIMAGGKGERFWPRSRKQFPKQFLSLIDSEETLIQLTVKRINHIVKKENIYIVTDKNYESLITEQLKDIPKDNILYEPIAKNTAPCICLGAMHIKKKKKDAVMFVLPADHLIKNEKEFEKVLKTVAKVVETEESMITIGIQPNYPETGYGYIKYNTNNVKELLYSVEKFVEKPDKEKAKEYLNEGNYFWNSGIFVWKVSSILFEIERCIPDLYKGLSKVENVIGKEYYQEILQKEYENIPSISIDFGVMEKCSNLLVYCGIFGWDDVGSWLSLERINKKDMQGNIVHGNVVSHSIYNCIIEGKDRLLAVAGLENVIVVDTEDVTMICSRDKLGEIKSLVQQLHCDEFKKYV